MLFGWKPLLTRLVDEGLCQPRDEPQAGSINSALDFMDDDHTVATTIGPDGGCLSLIPLIQRPAIAADILGEERMLMPGLVIEREVVIEAPVEVVWRTVTEPDQMSQWLADRVDLVVESGAHGYMQFGDQGGPVVVEAVDPPTRFSFRWNHPRGEEPVAGNSMLVEFTLTPEGDERTRLRVVESGHELLDWPDAEKQRYADEHRDGWAEYVDRLADTLAKGESG